MKEGTLGIASAAFEGCSGLTDIQIPNSVTSIGNGAFSGTQWYNNQPDGLVYAGLVAYNYKGSIPNNTNISLRQGTLGIAEEAFSSQTGLTNITIPNSVTIIGQLAFSGCSALKNIEIPNSVVFIGYKAFYRCRDLVNISVSNGNSKYDSRNDCNALIESSSNTLITGCMNTIIPNSVTCIGEYAFSLCTGLTSITIPNSVTSIGLSAFQNCLELTNITMSNSVISIGHQAFSYCKKLTTIEIPNSVTSIGACAFESCSSLFNISLSNSITTISYGVFLSCTGLTRIEIGNSVTSIDYSAFDYCPGIADFYCYATTPPECKNSFTSYSGTLHVPAASLAAYFIAPYWCNFENIVGDAVAPTGISISNDSIEIPLGEQFQLTATVTPINASNNDIHWESTNNAVATIENGTVTALSVGECDIIASCFGMQAVCHISVYQQIMLNQQEAMLLPNHMLTLTPSATPFLPELVVTSSDPMVAAARLMNGKVQVVGIKEGTTTITVGSADGTAVPATCFVTVYTEMGDVNCDGFVNITDVISIINYLSSGNDANIKLDNADFNGDSKVNITDVTVLINIIISSQ